MLKTFNAAVREAIYATGRTFADISEDVGVSHETIYRSTSENNTRRLHPHNAANMVRYLSEEIQAKVERYQRAIERLYAIRDTLNEEYLAEYITKEGKNGV